MFALVFAQESVTSSTIRWIIFALLAVAAALTILTVWFWKRTDPRARVAASRQPMPASAAGSGQQAGSGVAAAASGSKATVRSGSAAAADAHRDRAATEQQTSSPAVTDRDVAADEWLRLTGPQSLPRDRT